MQKGQVPILLPFPFQTPVFSPGQSATQQGSVLGLLEFLEKLCNSSYTFLDQGAYYFGSLNN